MTRKLHNTLMAAFASSSLLVVGLIASVPVAPHVTQASSVNALSSLETETQSTSEAIAEVNDLGPLRTHATRYRRQSLAMPFFSFAPRS